MRLDEKGFTLLEIVISIAALSLISVFILRMFLASSNLNKITLNADAALAEAITQIEDLKSYQDLSDYLSDLNDYSLENGGSITINRYYDKDWKPAPLTNGKPVSAMFHLKMRLEPETVPPFEESDVSYGALYKVNLEITEITPSNDEKEFRALASFETKKYFPMAFMKGGGYEG